LFGSENFLNSPQRFNIDRGQDFQSDMADQVIHFEKPLKLYLL